MLFNVPQFINVEDKVVGPLTAKQFGWLALGGIIMLVLFSFLDTQTFYVASIPVILLCLALAFYRPYGQPFVGLIGAMFSFFFKPKVYIWRKITESIKIEHRPRSNSGQKIVNKTVTSDNLSALTKSLDITRKSPR